MLSACTKTPTHEIFVYTLSSLVSVVCLKFECFDRWVLLSSPSIAFEILTTSISNTWLLGSKQPTIVVAGCVFFFVFQITISSELLDSRSIIGNLQCSEKEMH